MPERSIKAALVDEHPRLLALPGVVGTGEGRCDGALCIKVMVAKNSPALGAWIGAEIGGYNVELVETGEFLALGPGSK